MKSKHLRAVSLALTVTAFGCGDDKLSVLSPADCKRACEAVPPAECVDATHLKTYTYAGDVCDADGCLFLEVGAQCEGGCVTTDGTAQCAEIACAGVTCDSPPSACHAPVGICDGGRCEYAVLAGLPCDDSDTCTADDVCDSAGACGGEALACQTPAPSYCDGDTLKVSSSAGACVEGSCTYTTSDVACAEGCADGACLGDPCAGITCTTPPNGCYEAEGTCRDGVCDYAYDNGASCDDSAACTTNDVCTNGVCKGAALACTTPPASTCKDSATLTQATATGTCGDGTCTYTTTDINCELGCITTGASAACSGDPCGAVVCDTPPAPACGDANTLVVSAASGTCTAGDCEYATTPTTCVRGCAAGVGGAPARCLPPAGLVIAELLYDSAGSPDTEAFVELAGPAGTDLTGVELVGVNGNGGAEYNRIALSGVIGATGLYVIAHPQATETTTDSADKLDSKVDYQNGPDSLQLRFGGAVIDALAYGTFAETHVTAGEGPAAPATAVGLSLSRDRNNTDTNNNFNDFHVVDATPGAPSYWPEVAPEVGVTCPAAGTPNTDLSFTATIAAGEIANWNFDFGDGSAPVSQTAMAALHAYAAAGSYTVTVTGTTAGGQTDSASCTVTVDAAETAVTYASDELCFNGESYLYYVVSQPTAPTTDAKLTVRFKGLSSYGVRPYTIDIQTGANTWQTVAVTNESKDAWQTQNFVIPQGTLTAAISAMGWIRLRWSYLTNGASGNCVQLSLAYNCTACFDCPPGQQDLGIGCRSTTEPYAFTIGEHPRGYCASSSQQNLYLPGAPAPTGDGTVSIQSLGCGSANVTMRIYTQNSGWVDIGTGSGGNCFFSGASWTVPQAYLAAAVDSANRIRFRWDISDTCSPGTGCSSYSDPCLKNVSLTYPR